MTFWQLRGFNSSRSGKFDVHSFYEHIGSRRVFGFGKIKIPRRVAGPSHSGPCDPTLDTVGLVNEALVHGPLSLSVDSLAIISHSFLDNLVKEEWEEKDLWQLACEIQTFSTWISVRLCLFGWIQASDSQIG